MQLSAHAIIFGFVWILLYGKLLFRECLLHCSFHFFFWLSTRAEQNFRFNLHKVLRACRSMNTAAVWHLGANFLLPGLCRWTRSNCFKASQNRCCICPYMYSETLFRDWTQNIAQSSFMVYFLFLHFTRKPIFAVKHSSAPAAYPSLPVEVTVLWDHFISCTAADRPVISPGLWL